MSERAGAGAVAGAGAGAGSGWVKSPAYDLGIFFGGALGSFGAYALFLAGVPLLWLWWTWYLVFDATHLAATFTRSYFDPAMRAAERRVLLLSLTVFLVGPAAAFSGYFVGSSVPFLLFLAVASLASQVHIIRQHYGFVALYKARRRERDPLDFRLDKIATYTALGAPYAHFLIAQPAARRLLGLGPVLSAGERAALSALLGITLAAALAPAGRAIWLAMQGIKPNWPKVGYLVFVSFVNAFVYVVAGHAELPAENAQHSFLLVTLMTTLFHDVQYHGLVWLVNRRRYRSSVASQPRARIPAATVLGYVAFCGLFSALYWIPSCMTGWYVGCPKELSLGSAVLRDALYGGVVWGVTLHHYIIDMVIWRVKSDARLLDELGMGAPALAALPLHLAAPASAALAAPAAYPTEGS